jgi:hypothetical protein
MTVQYYGLIPEKKVIVALIVIGTEYVMISGPEAAGRLKTGKTSNNKIFDSLGIYGNHYQCLPPNYQALSQ